MNRRALVLAAAVAATGITLSLAGPWTGQARSTNDCETAAHSTPEHAASPSLTPSPTLTPTDPCNAGHDDTSSDDAGTGAGDEATEGGDDGGGGGGPEPTAAEGADEGVPTGGTGDQESADAGGAQDDETGSGVTDQGPTEAGGEPTAGAGTPADGGTPVQGGVAPADGGTAPEDGGAQAGSGGDSGATATPGGAPSAPDGGAQPGTQPSPGGGTGAQQPGGGGPQQPGGGAQPGTQPSQGGGTGAQQPGGGGVPAGQNGTDLSEPVTGEPDLNAFAPNRTVEPGADRRIAVSVVNSGTVDEGGTGTPPAAERAVTTARNVRVTITEGDAPVTVESGTVPLGDLRSGTVSRTAVAIAVDDDADPGTYELDAEIEYEFTSEIDANESETDTETVTVPVELVVTDAGRFEVDSVDERLRIGEQGAVELDIENTGSADLTEASVLVRSQTGALLVDGSAGRQPVGDDGESTGAGATRFVGDWEAGDTETITFSATPTNRSATQDYALEAVVRYVDPDGDQRRSRPLTFGVTPDQQQNFSLDDLEGDLEVDADGTITGEITNEGPAPATDAAVRVVTGPDVAVDATGRPDATVVARRESVVLGDLDEGEDEDFEIPVTVPDDVEPGEVQVRLVVSYLDAQGDPRESRPLRGAVEIDGEDPDFTLEAVDGDVQVGEDGTVSVTLSNEVDETLTDARVSLASRSDDLRVGGGVNASRFVGTWDEDENQTVVFDVTATNASEAAAYPLTIRVAYTVDGDEERSDPIRTSVEPDGEQGFAIRNVDAALRVGERGTVSGRVVNTGGRNVSNAALVVETGDETVTTARPDRPLGDLAVNDTATFSYPFELAADAEPGPRQFRFAVEYETADGDRRRSDRLTVTVSVSAERDGFAVLDTTVETQAGDSGTLAVTVVNRRSETVTDARVGLRSNSAELTVGGADNSTRFVGRWRPGENRTVEYEVATANDSSVQSYAVRALVAYTDARGDERESAPIRFGLVPLPEQTFAITNVTSTLRVAEEGDVAGRLRNGGPTNVTAAVLRLRTDTETTNPQETEFALGDLAAGSSSHFSLPVEITADGAATPRLFSFRVAYADAQGDRTTSETLTARVPVRPERDRFAVRGVDATVVQGETETVTLVVRNARNATLRDVNAKVFVDDPLDTDDGEAFVSVLGPNESVRFDFDVSAAGDASPGTVPLRIDFEYELPDGDTELSKTYQVGVTVAEPEGGGLLDGLWPFGVVTLLAVTGGLIGRRYVE